MSLRRNFLSRRIGNGSFSFSCRSLKESARTLEIAVNGGNCVDTNVIPIRDDDDDVLQHNGVISNAEMTTFSPSPWSNMLPELLGEIIQRVEASEDKWPDRKSVVYCGCVCKQWRKVTKEVVAASSSQINNGSAGKITFPSCLKKVYKFDFFYFVFVLICKGFHVLFCCE